MAGQPKSQNLVRMELDVTRDERERLMGHRGATVWFTGLSASGKSTIARLVDRALTLRGVHCAVLDGDDVRHGLNRDLGFGPADRTENIRRVGEVARILTQAGIVNLTAFISPYREDRDRSRAMQDQGDFFEVYVRCPLVVCEGRDPKGLYRRARSGEIPQFTGISAPYVEPLHAELVLDTDLEPPGRCVERVLQLLERRGVVAPAAAEAAQQR